ncbi:MAG: helix-turn-helix domain-containing protein [Thermomicrobiales bacterium]
MVSTANTELLTIREAAQILRVSEVTISRWIKQGRLPSYRVGPRVIRIRRDDLDRIVTPETPETSESSDEFVDHVPIYDWSGNRVRIRKPTKKDNERVLAWLEETRKFREEMRRSRGGRLVPSSAPIIAEERDKRGDQLSRRT